MVGDLGQATTTSEREKEGGEEPLDKIVGGVSRGPRKFNGWRR